VAGIDTPAGYTRLEQVRAGPEVHVYRAWDERAGRWMMLRLFHRFVSDRTEEVAFAEYVAASVGLGGDMSIVPVRAGGITGTGRPWLALDDVDGRLLADVLRDDPPSPVEALRLTVALADALAWAHTRRPPMVHGRIRAEHVIITPGGTPLITDFSVPRLHRAPQPNPVDDVTDLGALLFRAITGHPWPGRGPSDDLAIALWPGLTELLDEVLTPVPAIDTMAVFAARLRQVRGAADPVVPFPAVSGEETPPASPALEHQDLRRYGGKLRSRALALVAQLMPRRR
jgi:hypothetical protein